MCAAERKNRRPQLGGVAVVNRGGVLTTGLLLFEYRRDIHEVSTPAERLQNAAGGRTSGESPLPFALQVAC